MNKVWDALTGEGGLLRVRAALAMGMTAIGGLFIITNEQMPPAEFNILWTAAVTYYFGTRGSA